MASTTRDEPLIISSATAASARAVAVGAAPMVAAAGSSGVRQHSTGLLEEREDEHVATKGQAPASMHPLLLAASCNGDWEGLNFLLNREETQVWASQVFLGQLAPYTSGNITNGSLAMEEAVSDAEQGATTPLMSAASLLEGVTVEGYTALHVVAANGDGDNYLKCADLISGMATNHLSALNNKGDTPLHCATRGGKSQMVSYLIDLASRRDDTGDDRSVKEFVRKENHQKETALHEAVRIGDNHIVEVLMTADPELASFPEGYTSALYLAILLGKYNIAQTLYDKSKQSALSYAGPNGQNALHAAVMRGKVPTNVLLQWNKCLATLSDETGSTPLHFAAALSSQQWFVVCLHVFEANPRALYHSDRDGMFPIHVAASVGAKEIIIMFLTKYPSSAGLRDARGRTFLHIAVDKEKVEIVRYACRTQGLTWILNMQDNDGNTALHLAVEAGALRVFCALYGNRLLHLNLINHKGQTPLDISRYKMLPGLQYIENSEERICKALTFAGAMSGASRQDYFQETYEHIHQLKSDGEAKRLDKLKDSTQTLCIGSVLIATVTFSATFAVPGGYRADDHTNGGTPTLAGGYTFDAFIVANTLAFICSAIATISLISSGISMNDSLTRQIHLAISIVSMSSSVTSLTAAFAIGVYMVLAPVAQKTAILICVLSPLVLLWGNSEHWLKWALMLRSVCSRMGLINKALLISAVETFAYLFLEFWPLIFIFSWPAIARNHQHH